MKKILTTLLCLGFLLASVPGAYAQGPDGDWTSDIACQNLDQSNSAEITISFYVQNSEQVAATYTDTIPAGGSRNYSTRDAALGVPEGFVGSAVVTSSRSVICTVNTQTTGDGTSESPYRIASSSGLIEAEIASTKYAPQVMKEFYGWNSYFAVQNASSSETTITITYKDRAGNDMPAATETATIPGYSTIVFDQTENPEIPANFIGAAKVSVSNPVDAKIALLVNFFNSGTDSSTSQFHGYNGLSSGASKLYVPRVVRRFYGYSSGIAIQNVSDVATTITITFNFAGQSYTYNSDSINPSAALALYIPDLAVLDPVDALPVGQRFGNAIIEVDNPEGRVVAIVNEDNRGNPADNDGNAIPVERVGQGSTYSAIPAGSETRNLYFPQVPNNVDGIFSGGFNISNVTSSPGICDIHFNEAPEAKINDVEIAASGTLSYYAPNIPNLPSGFNSGVRVECTVEVIGILNFAAAPGSNKLGDSFTQNNGFNK